MRAGTKACRAAAASFCVLLTAGAPAPILFIPAIDAQLARHN